MWLAEWQAKQLLLIASAPGPGNSMSLLVFRSHQRIPKSA
jgi:hypothetical protein